MRVPLTRLSTLLLFGLAVGTGCSSSPAQTADAGPDGGGADADAGPDASDGGSSLTGVHGWLVTSTVTQQPGAGPALTTIPASHQFTVVLDAVKQQAIIGSVNGSSVVPFTLTDAGVIQLRQLFDFTFNCDAEIAYSSVDLTLGANGALTGTGSGTAVQITTDVGSTVDAQMALAGVPDTTPPKLVGDATTVDPFYPLTLKASEPLAPGVHPQLVDASGTGQPLSASAGETTAAFLFSLPGTLLRFGEAYHVTLAGITDFSGNLARTADDFAFTTTAAPPLVPEDGFESATGATLGGAQILSGAGAPTIAGAQSLYIPPLASPGAAPSGWSPQLAVRLTLNPGDTVVRFSYELVSPSYPVRTVFMLASVGGQITSPPAPTYATTPTTTATLGGSTATIGPLSTAQLPLPPNAAGEIVLELVVPGVTCPTVPAPSRAGFIMDDLRAE
jgi:hypothetical protein